MDAIDRALVLATQEGLPLVSRPYDAIAGQLGVEPAEVLERLQAMLAAGQIRRVAAVPNHYAMGYVANAMSVWDVADEQVAELGEKVGALTCVSHCYQRPRHQPVWPYNLFVMLHGRSRDEVSVHAARVQAVLGPACRGHQLLYSSRILKKTGLRLRA